VLHRNVLGTDSKGAWLDFGKKRYASIEVPDKQLRSWAAFVSEETQLFSVGRALKDILLGLRSMHVHRSRFIHRDLHTGNVMVRSHQHYGSPHFT
jgi:aminoglycoside phosphotransferase (APT) family kinase protein